MNTSRRLPYLLMLPGIALLLAVLYPFLSGVYWSFTNFDLTLGQNPAFSGLTNYLQAFSLSGEGLHAILVTFAYAALAVAVQTLLGFGVALLLMREGLHIRFFRALIVLPLLMPPVIATMMWRVMMTPDGVLNYMLSWVYLTVFDCLESTSTAVFSVVLIDTWIYTPYVILILLAGMQSIPTEVHEAARVDGASYLREIWNLVVPLLRPFFIIVIVFRGIDSLKMFDIIYTATRGGPINATMNLHVQSYFTGIRSLNIGYSMTFLVVLWVLCYALAFVLLRVRRGRLA
ncbi:MAG TPA: sugar ABC transporter permease [Chloroflexia bacterium]|nr:sugar ABC transporter permease [Chloroflexia bacterium]